MDENLGQVIVHHWPLFLALWLTSNIISAMPSPNGTGPTSTWWYKWMFSALHGLMGNGARIAAALSPAAARVLGAVDKPPEAAGGGQK